jgi:hypothetical protein
MKAFYQVQVQNIDLPTQYFSKKHKAIEWAKMFKNSISEISICTLTKDHLLRLLNQEGGYISESNLIITIYPTVDGHQKIVHHEPPIKKE